MTPKSLLRLAEASSPWADFTRGTFQRVIGEVSPAIAPHQVTRLILCSGKVYFDVVEERTRLHHTTTAIVRLEQLYPLPEAELRAVLQSYSALREIFWVQEEPKNAGAWRYLLEPLTGMIGELSRPVKFKYVGRPESASPATGFTSSHKYEQKLLVDEALSS